MDDTGESWLKKLSLYHQRNITKFPLFVDIPNGAAPGYQLYFHIKFAQYVSASLVVDLLSVFDDIVLRFNPILEKSLTLLNRRYKGKWGRDLRPPGIFPFQKGFDYKLVFQILSDKIIVFINHQRYVEFEHFVDVSSIISVSVDGHINLMEFRIDSPVLPFVSAFENGLKISDIVVINGVVNSSPIWFTISFHNERLESDSEHIPLCLNPRFEAGILIIRSKAFGKWLSSMEQVENYIPFFPSKLFEISIRCDQKQFQIAVDGTNFCNYVHRTGVQSCHFITVRGDIKIDNLRMRSISKQN